MGEVKRLLVFLLVGLCPGMGMIIRGNHLKQITPVITGEDLLGTEGHYMEDSLQQTTGWILFIIGILWVVCAVIALIISVIITSLDEKVDGSGSEEKRSNGLHQQSHVLVEKRQKKHNRPKLIRSANDKERTEHQKSVKRRVVIVVIAVIVVAAILIPLIGKLNNGQEEAQEPIRLSAEEASSRMATHYTCINNQGKKVICTFDNAGEVGFVMMARYDETGEIEYNSGFYYGIRKIGDQLELDIAYPKKSLFSNNYGEYTVTSTDGTMINEFKSINDWEWSGTYEIGD